VAGRAEPQEGGGLARVWTTCGPKMQQHQCPNEAPGGAERTVDMEQQFCFVFAVVSVHSVVLPTIFEKYIQTKIEAILLKSVAYKTLDIHLLLSNPLLGELLYCKASNQLLYQLATLPNRGLSSPAASVRNSICLKVLLRSCTCALDVFCYSS